jgi:hypothetical protein
MGWDSDFFDSHALPEPGKSHCEVWGPHPTSPVISGTSVRNALKPEVDRFFALFSVSMGFQGSDHVWKNFSHSFLWDFGLFSLLWAPGLFGTTFATQVWVNLRSKVGCHWKVLSMGFPITKEICAT